VPLITPTEVNTLAFITPVDPALILEEIIMAAETKYIAPAVTQLVYDDLSVNPGLYATLISDYIKPYLAFCVKLLLYNQYLTETGTFDIPTQQRWDVVQEIIVISKAKKTLLVNHLSAALYPLYIAPVNKRITGFIVK
jgi:hypothetical protein